MKNQPLFYAEKDRVPPRYAMQGGPGNFPPTWRMAAGTTLVGTCEVKTLVVDSRGERVWVRWQMYREPSRQKVPNLYLCRLDLSDLYDPTSDSISLDLYAIGAQGNNHNVDVYGCDPEGNSLHLPFWQLAAPGPIPTAPSAGVPQPTFPLENPAALPHARFDDDKGRATNKVKYAAQGNPTNAGLVEIHLWARSHRYPEPVQPPSNQDGDGSPPEGEPGGEANLN